MDLEIQLSHFRNWHTRIYTFESEVLNLLTVISYYMRELIHPHNFRSAQIAAHFKTLKVRPVADQRVPKVQSLINVRNL